MKRLFSLLLFLIFTASLTLALLYFVQAHGGVELSTPEYLNEFFVPATKHEKTNNKHEAVDLGLSVKWASCNVGANNPEDYGAYYAWGETEEKSDYSQETYKHVDTGIYKYLHWSISRSPYDVAHMKWGGSWRMPTFEEIEELLDKCSSEWTSVNGIEGLSFTGPNGNSIFLPAAGLRRNNDVEFRGSCGHYWSSTFYDNTSGRLNFYNYSNVGSFSLDNRYYGHTVRPVTE